MDSFISWLKELSTWMLIFLLVISAIVISECIVATISFLWVDRLDDMMLFAGFVTPLVASLSVGGILVLLIRRLRITENQLKLHQKTIEDNNIQLKMAYQKAQQANSAKSDFLANMSHEIRTPINGIMGMIELVLETELDKDQKDNLQIASESTKTLMAIISDVLELSQIESGKVKLRNEPFVIRDKINELSKSFQTQASLKDLAFSCEIDPELPTKLTGDIYRINGVLLNLLGNAIKFTSQGEISLRVDMVDKTNDNLLIEFTVSDTGIGIPEDKLETIFQSFVQGDTSTTRSFGGSGLGLTIAKKLSDIMRGKLSVESEVGKGSRFSFQVPLTEDKSSGNGATNQTRLTDLKNARILLADDSYLNQVIVRKFLENEIGELIIVSNGQEAIDFLKKEDCGLVLMDIKMPVLSGIDAVKMIRQGKTKDPGIPILAFTANVYPSERDLFFKAGIDDFLAKPVRKKDLINMLRRYIVKNNC